MQLLKRIGIYFIGVSLGVVIVSFFWKQKNVSFDYLPNARTLKNIRIKKRLFSKNAKQAMIVNKIDTTTISVILKTGEVNFEKSKPRQKPCREYWIDSKKLETQISLIITNCDTTATIEKILTKN